MQSLRARIVDVLERYSTAESLYIDPRIPPKKLAKLRSVCRIPSDESVIAILDCTVFGSAKNGVVFGERALYYHNSWTVAQGQFRGPGSVPYGDLATIVFTRHFMEVRFAGGAIEISGSSFDVKRLLELLEELQRALGDHSLPYGKSIVVSVDPVSRLCLEPSNEIWPNGIATRSDASYVFPPLTLAWERELEAHLIEPVALYRDMAIVVVGDGPLHRNRCRLVAHELTTGRVFWRREVERPDGPLVATDNAVFVRRGALWFAFDVETGEPRREPTTLTRALREQLVLAVADIDEPSSYCDFVTNLDGADLIAANLQRRVYAEALALIAVDWNGARRTWPVDRRFAFTFCMTERFLLLGTALQLAMLDAADARAPRYDLALPFSPTAISVGSDHVLVGAGSRLACYRGSSETAWRTRG